MRYWMCSGTQENIDTALTVLKNAWGIWGIEEKKDSTPTQCYHQCKSGDIVFFYSTKKIGVCAWGIIDKKVLPNGHKIWQKEREENRVIYNLRFRFYKCYYNKPNWGNPVDISDLATMPIIGGMNRLEEDSENLRKLLQRCRKTWGYLPAFFPWQYAIWFIYKINGHILIITLKWIAISLITIGGFLEGIERLRSW